MSSGRISALAAQAEQQILDASSKGESGGAAAADFFRC